MVKKWSFFLLLCCVSKISAVLNINKKSGEGRAEIWPVEEDYNKPIVVNGVIYKVSKKYYCTLFDDAEDRQTMLYGRQGWVFPRQDVNLTLAYPSATWKATIPRDYVITGYQVILFTDGLEGSAYINSGGLMENNLSLTFISNEITTLYYRFWLYGATRGQVTGRDPENLC